VAILAEFLKPTSVLNYRNNTLDATETSGKPFLIYSTTEEVNYFSFASCPMTLMPLFSRTAIAYKSNRRHNKYVNQNADNRKS